MTILLPALGITFAAFCVWLTVRIVNRRERWAKWTLAVLLIGLPLLYVASFGPLFWLDANGYVDRDSLAFDACRIYAAPIDAAYAICPDLVRDALDWYGDIFR